LHVSNKVSNNTNKWYKEVFGAFLVVTEFGKKNEKKRFGVGLEGDAG